MKLNLKSPLGDTLNKQIEESAITTLIKSVDTIFASYKATVDTNATTLEEVQGIVRDLALVLEVLVEGKLEDGLRVQQEESESGAESTNPAVEETSGIGADSSDETGTDDKQLGEYGRSDSVIIFKDAQTGQYRWFGIVSNNYTDRHSEIITKEAHLDFIDALKNKAYPYPELRFHHDPSLIMGTTDYVNFDESSGMLIGSGLFDVEYNVVAEGLMESDLAWGMSHGMPIHEMRREKSNQKIIKRYRSKEFSFLRLPKTANPLTDFGTGEEKVAQREEIRQDLSKLVRDADQLEKLVGKMDKQAEIAQELDLTSKENEVEVELEVKEQDALQEVVKQFIEAFTPVMDEVKALRAEVAELRTGAVAKAIDSPAITVADLVKKYMEPESATATKPDPKSFTTPQVNKGVAQEDNDFFAALASGNFDKPARNQ